MAATEVTAAELEVPGARLHYEVRGSGPLLLVIGAPMGTMPFAGFAERLAAAGRTVLTYDPRGIGRSPIVGDPTDTPEVRADDVRRLIVAAGGGPVDVFGSSGGAVTGLALVAAHPELVRTLVAHEPPLLELLDDRDRQRAWVEGLLDLYRAEGPAVAMVRFMTELGVDPKGMPSLDELPAPVREQMLRDNDHFFGHQMYGTTVYRPDLAALRAASTRVVIGLGGTSDHGNVAYRGGAVLAEGLGIAPVAFPGDHGGFMGDPQGFADTLLGVLGEPPSSDRS